MATPSVLTVPSMYGDGILYSGPTAYGNQLITNGNFQTDTNWTKGTGTTISGGKANFSSATSVSLFQNIGSQSGFVQVEFNITEYTSGTLNVYSGGNETVSNINIVGNKIGRYTAKVDRNGGNNNIIFGSSDNFTGSITNVSVKEITQGSDFEFTRSTTGTRINEEGYIEDVPYNFAAFSEDFNNSDWVKANANVTSNVESSPKGNLTADLINSTTTSGSYAGTTITVTNSSEYNISTFAKKGNANYLIIILINGANIVRQWYDLENGTLGGSLNVSSPTVSDIKIENSGNGWYRCSLTFQTVSTSLNTRYYISDADLVISSAVGKNIYLWGAQIVKGDQPKNYLPTTDRLNLPRLNYPPYGGCPSLLVEPQRTNSISYSTDFSNAAWVKGNSTITANQTIAPDGTLSADLLQLTVAGGNVYDSLGGSGDYAFSVFAKYKDAQFIRLRSTGSYAYFDIQNGVLGSTINVLSSKIENYGNGWFRCTVVGNNSNSLVQIFVSDVDGSNTGTGSVFLWGAQMEAGNYPTSLIHTSGSTETRNEDKALYAGLGTTDNFNDSEGVLFIETEALTNNNEARIISINAGNGLNRVTTGYPSSGDSSIIAYLQTTAGSGASMTITGVDTTQKHKIAFKYKLNDSSIFIDGVKRNVDTNVAMPVGLQQLDFANGIGIGVAEYRGNLNAIAVYKTALADTELANLTSYNNHDLFIPYRSRMQMISADQELQCTEHDITRFL